MKELIDPDCFDCLNLWEQTPQNGQTHSNNSSARADELFECVWPFYGVGAEWVKDTNSQTNLKYVRQFDIVYFIRKKQKSMTNALFSFKFDKTTNSRVR